MSRLTLIIQPWGTLIMKFTFTRLLTIGLVLSLTLFSSFGLAFTFVPNLMSNAIKGKVILPGKYMTPEAIEEAAKVLKKTTPEWNSYLLEKYVYPGTAEICERYSAPYTDVNDKAKTIAITNANFGMNVFDPGNGKKCLNLFANATTTSCVETVKNSGKDNFTKAIQDLSKSTNQFTSRKIHIPELKAIYDKAYGPFATTKTQEMKADFDQLSTCPGGTDKSYADQMKKLVDAASVNANW